MKPDKSKGGRPGKLDAGKLEEKILLVATRLFLKDGYGATSIESIAKVAGVSKRTLYHRYADKSELFSAVMQRLIGNMRPGGVGALFVGENVEAVLKHLAEVILQAALSKEALALHRLLVAEAARFPVLAKILSVEGSRREAVERITALLADEARKGRMDVPNPEFAAEQFLQMLISTPQNRALGLGVAMDEAEVKRWGEQTVEFFLRGCSS